LGKEGEKEIGAVIYIIEGQCGLGSWSKRKEKVGGRLDTEKKPQKQIRQKDPLKKTGTTIRRRMR